MRLTLSAILINMLLTGCGNPALQGLDSPSSESVATTTDYKPVVMVLLPGGEGLCSGTFIAPRAVLTAAHCTPSDGTYTVVTSYGTFYTNNVQKLGSGTVEDTHDISVLLFDNNVANANNGETLPVGAHASRLDRVRLVGFGCDDIDTRDGAGIKRTGTNQIAILGSYIELMTPNREPAQNKNQVSRIIGPSNRAGSCFGDSGGPLMESADYPTNTVGVVHAGGAQGDLLVSEYTNLLETTNHEFLVQLDEKYQLSLFQCPDGSPEGCGNSSASVQIISFFNWLWGKALSVMQFLWQI